MYMVKGTFREEAGGVTIRHGKLMVEERDGAYYDAQSGGRLTATAFAVTDQTRGIDITSDRDAYHFDPDADECERIGMSVLGAPRIVSYTVREPGKAAWESDIKTLKAAESSCGRALARGVNGATIYAEYDDGATKPVYGPMGQLLIPEAK